MIYCKLCRKKHKKDKEIYQIAEPITMEVLRDLFKHQISKHGLADFRITNYGETALKHKPEDIVRILNQKIHKSRKEKKKMKTSWRKENF